MNRLLYVELKTLGRSTFCWICNTFLNWRYHKFNEKIRILLLYLRYSMWFHDYRSVFHPFLLWLFVLSGVTTCEEKWQTPIHMPSITVNTNNMATVKFLYAVGYKTNYSLRGSEQYSGARGRDVVTPLIKRPCAAKTNVC